MSESSIQPDQMTYNAAMNLFAKVTVSFRCFRWLFFCFSYVKEDLYQIICVERILSIEALPGSWVASGSAVAEWYAYQLAGARRSEFPNNQRWESLQTVWQRVLSKICKKHCPAIIFFTFFTLHGRNATDCEAFHKFKRANHARPDPCRIWGYSSVLTACKGDAWFLSLSGEDLNFGYLTSD